MPVPLIKKIKNIKYIKPIVTVVTVLTPLLLGGCGIDQWFGSSAPPPLPGERVSVLELDRGLQPDPQLAAAAMTLPAPVRNPDWPQPGGTPTHVMGHLALSMPFREAWSTSIGAGSSSTRRLINPPIVAGGRIYVMDAEDHLVALEPATGRQLWRVLAASPQEDSTPLGGGVAFADGALFVTTGYGEILAIDPANGGMIWHAQATSPIRAAPTVDSGRVFVITVDNQTEARDVATGEVRWTHTGILETAGMLGGASPAVGSGIVLSPYSSGEIYALRIETGRSVWSDSLAAVHRVGALASLADIRGMPVLDGNLVFAISHSGRMAAIDLRTGARVWEQQVGGIQTPWLAGDSLFVVDNNNEVVALKRDTGQVRWVTALARWRNPDDRRGPIVWAGPVLAGGRLILVRSEGEAALIDPTTGRLDGTVELRGGSEIPPIVADGTLYVLSDDGTLTAYR